MKPTSFLISFLLFSIFINSFSCSAAQALEPVLDIEANSLSPSSSYYVLPSIWPGGGGVTLASIGNETCPLDVVQEPSTIITFKKGLPVKFTSVNPNEEVIRASTDLNIEFTVETVCKSTVWKVDKYDESTGQYFIATDGVKGNPGPETITNWFTIEKLSTYFYKLVYSPKVCPFCQPIRKDIGVFIQDVYRRLALSDSELVVYFQKLHVR